MSEQTVKEVAAKAGKYLTFKLANEEYGLEILKVREIIGLMTVTKVPRTPAFVKGVINLRGMVIPVVDLRSKFGMETIEDTSETCIIVVEIIKNDAPVQIGILVDAVSEVMDIVGDEIESTPSFGTDIDTGYILGMAKTQGTVRILLNIMKVLTEGEFQDMSTMRCDYVDQLTKKEKVNKQLKKEKEKEKNE